MATNVGPHLNPNPRCSLHPHLDNLASHLQTYKHHNLPPRAIRTLYSRPHIVAHLMPPVKWASRIVCHLQPTGSVTTLMGSDSQLSAALCSMVLDSQRESRRYQDAFVDVFSSERERKALYTLGDPTIERMLNILKLVSMAQSFHLVHPCSLLVLFDQRSHALTAIKSRRRRIKGRPWFFRGDRAADMLS